MSCDPATLARDLKYLAGNGYEPVKARVFDNFAQGVHCETVCLLSKFNIEQHIEVELMMNKMDLTASGDKASYEEISSG